jgi:carbamoyl-phosphate synthase large subunit
MKKTILVSGASGIVGYGILRSLRKGSEEYRLIGTSIYDFSIAPAFCDIFVKVPPTADPNYTNRICDVLEKYSVDMSIPGIECDMFQWNEDRGIMQASGTFPLLNNASLITLCQDKWFFYQKLKDNLPEIAIPTAVDVDYNTFPTPFLLKPRRGYGSKGIIRVNNQTDFDNHKSRIGKELMLQPIVGCDEEEYTVSAFFGNDSQLIDYFPLKRKLSRDGFTQEAQVVAHDFSVVLCNLADVFQPVGPTNFQFRLSGGETKLLEINPRISSATSIRTHFGYNESVMSVEYFLNKRIPIPCDRTRVNNKRAIRFTEDYIFE